MKFVEEQKDLFTVPQGYYLAHCISGDYALGAGIAKQFVEIYNMRYKLHKNYPLPNGEKFANVGQALLIDNAFNLVTKPKVNGLNIEKICYVIPKPIELCKFDNQSREHPVPEYVLDKQIGKFQIPFYEEGFDQIIIHRNSAWKEYQMDDIKLFLAMWGYDQKNPHHNMMLDDHCLNAYKLFCGKIQHNTLLNLEYINGYAMGAKLHDFGKMMTQTFDEDGVAHYFGHAEAGSYFILSQMIIPVAWTKNELLNCCFLINYHMMPFGWANEKSKHKWQRRFGEYKYKMLMDFNECDRAR